MTLTAQALHDDVVAVLDDPPASIGPDEDLLELGLDSVRLMSLVERWRAAGAEVEFADLAESPTLAHWAVLLPPPASRVRYPLAPRVLDVRRVEQLTPRMVRVTLAGPQLAGFRTGAPTDHVKLFFPAERGAEPRLPAVVDDRPVHTGPVDEHRDYTVRTFAPEAGELDVDLVLHGEGVASRWAATARPGDRLGVLGPRGSVVRPRDLGWYLLAVDETALPAAARWLEELAPGSRAILLAEVDGAADELDLACPGETTVRWLHRSGGAALEQALRDTALPAGDGYVWVAGEATALKPIRRYLRDELRPPRWEVDGYWRRGVADHDHHEEADDQ